MGKYEEHFCFSPGRKHLRCKHCTHHNGSKGIYKNSGSTTILKKHLLKTHGIDTDPLPVTGKPLSNAVVNLLLCHDIAKLTPDCQCLKNLIKVARETTDKLECASTINDLFTRRYLTQKQELMQTLLAEEFISISLDHWTSPQTQSFIGVIANWMDKNFNHQYALVDFKPDQDHCSAMTYVTIDSILMDFGISSPKISGVVGDATNSMKNALAVIAASHINGIPHVCLNHVLQRALVTNYTTIPRIRETIETCKAIVNFIKNSPKFFDLLKETVVEEERGKMPVVMNTTRWDTLKLMFDSVQSQFYVINTAILKYKRENLGVEHIQKLPCFEPEAIHVIENLQQVLTTLWGISQGLQQRDRSIAYLIPTYYMIQDILTQEYSEEWLEEFCTDVWKGFKRRVEKHYFDKDTNQFHMHYIVAAFLAPNCFRLIRGRDEFNSFEQIFKDYIKTLPGEEHNEQRARAPTRRSSTYDELFSLAIENDISITATPSSINTEISDYLNRAYLNPTISASDWWKTNRKCYPTIAKQARKFLAIPVTSAEVERLFSQSGHIISNDRCRLNPQSCKELVFLKVKDVRKHITKI